MSLPVELLSTRNKTENDAVRQDLDINHFIENKEFLEAFENQYLRYQNIGLDIFEQYSPLTDIDLDTFRDFLVHIHETIISIPEYNYTQFTETQLRFVTTTLYKSLFMELPTLLNNESLENVTDPEDLKHQLVDHYTNTFDVLKDLAPGTPETLGVGYMVEVYDNNLTDLINNHIVRLNIVS